MELLFYIIALVAAITIHEFAHASVADRFGDPTPRLAGRVTLNPLAHLDPLGTIALVLFHFGWGKPVPVNSRHFANPLWDEIVVSLAGPFANVALAVTLGVLLRVLPVDPLLSAFITIAVQINLVLAIFNLIPLPPLDGSRILRLFVSEQTYAYFEQFGPFFLLFLFLVGSPIISQLFAITVTPLSHIILGR